eukprot:178755_1
MINIPNRNVLDPDILPPYQYKFSIISPAPEINPPRNDNNIYVGIDDYRWQNNTDPLKQSHNKIYADTDDYLILMGEDLDEDAAEMYPLSIVLILNEINAND